MTTEQVKDFLVRQGFEPNEHGNFICSDNKDTQFNILYILEDLLQEAES